MCNVAGFEQRRHFFIRPMAGRLALEKIIKLEDKQKPLSDDLLADKLKQKGFTLARRTVAKYRDQLGYPVARLRKEI